MESVLLVLLCLSGWFILPSCPLRQYYFVNEPLTWHEAQTYCRDRFSDLATIDNVTEMDQLFDTVHHTGYTSDVWIGLYATIEWNWSDGISKGFRIWADGEPKFSPDRRCVSTATDGKWTHIRCDISFPFICYEGPWDEPDYVFVNQAMSWDDARQHCRETYTDLVAIWDDFENYELEHMAASEGRTWIGLFSSAHYYWSDNSHTSFTNWGTVELELGAMTNVCAVASLPESGKWKLSSCQTKLPFVCYAHGLPIMYGHGGTKKKRVVKLRIKLDDSSVDLNDPAVKAALLKKLQDRLKEEGVNEVNLKWKEQPDGEVWHKEEL